MSVIVTDALLGPLLDGLNVTVMRQEAPAATELPQPETAAKSPLAPTLVMVSGPAPVLVSANCCGALVVF